MQNRLPHEAYYSRRPLSALVAALVSLIGASFFIASVVSIPITRTVNFAYVTNAAGEGIVDFGLFGACWWEQGGFPDRCVRELGWRLDVPRFGGITFPARIHFRLFQLSRGLVSDALTLGFLGLNVLCWVARFVTNLRQFRFIAVLFYIMAMLSSFIAWGHNIATAHYVKSFMRSVTRGEFVGHIGNAVWLTLAGTIWVLLGMFIQFSAGHWCCYPDDPEYMGAPYIQGGPPPPSGSWAGINQPMSPMSESVSIHQMPTVGHLPPPPPPPHAGYMGPSAQHEGSMPPMASMGPTGRTGSVGPTGSVGRRGSVGSVGRRGSVNSMEHRDASLDPMGHRDGGPIMNQTTGDKPLSLRAESPTIIGHTADGALVVENHPPADVPAVYEGRVEGRTVDSEGSLYARPDVNGAVVDGKGSRV